MMPVPEWLVNLYQWITHLSPLWLIVIAIFWKPLVNFYNRHVKEPDQENQKRLDVIEKELQIAYEVRQRNEEIFKALLHHEIFQTAREAIKKDHITEYELENLEELYRPYKKLGGNGTAEKLYNDCKQLEIKT